MKGQEFDAGGGAAGASVDGGAKPGRSGGSRRFLRVSGLMLVAVVLAFAGGFTWFAIHISGLSAPKELRSADAIIVLTGGQSRLDAAVDLLRTGKGRRLLISGVNPMAGRDDLAMATGGDASLFSCCVDIDHAALDTIGNAEESAKWMTRHAYSSVILVTNNYHMPRSVLEMHRMLDNADLQPYPVVNTPLDNGEWLTKPDALRVLFTEYTKYLAALTRSALSRPAGNVAAADPALATMADPIR